MRLPAAALPPPHTGGHGARLEHVCDDGREVAVQGIEAAQLQELHGGAHAVHCGQHDTAQSSAAQHAVNSSRQ
jgi:hypothetical protein